MTGTNEVAELAADIVSELHSQGQVPLQHDVGASSVVPDKPETARTAVRPAEAEAIRPKPNRSEGLQSRPHREIVNVIERKDAETVVGVRNLVGTVGIAHLDSFTAGAQPYTGEETPRIREGRWAGACTASGSTNQRASKRKCGVPDERGATFSESLDAQWRALSPSRRATEGNE